MKRIKTRRNNKHNDWESDSQEDGDSDEGENDNALIMNKQQDDDKDAESDRNMVINEEDMSDFENDMTTAMNDEDDNTPLLLNDGKSTKKGSSHMTDPVIDTIGNFGIYQLVIAIPGLFQSMVSSWQVLSFKFIGIKTDFRCVEGLGGEDHCLAYGGNSTVTPCSKFVYDGSNITATIIQRWDLVCKEEAMADIAQSIFFAGCLIGLIVSGFLADRYGRRPVLLCNTLLYIISGVLSSLTPSLHFWLGLTLLRGGSMMAAGTVRYVIQVEMLGGAARVWVNVLGGFGWIMGYMTLPLLAYEVKNMALLEAIIALAALPFLGLFWCYPESPRWLISKQRNEEAHCVITKAAAWNKKDANKLTLDMLRKYSEDNEKSSKDATLREVFQMPGLRRNLLSMCVCWFAIGMSYFGLALHTPEFGSSVFVVFFISGLMEVPMLIIGPTAINYFGRRCCMTGGLLMGATALLSTSVIPKGLFYKEWPIIVLAILGKMVVGGLGFESAYIFTSELFPTVVRNTVLSTASSCARLGAIVAPLVADIDSSRPGLPLVIYGIVTLLAGLQSVLLWPETLKIGKLPDTLEEGEKMSQWKSLL